VLLTLKDLAEDSSISIYAWRRWVRLGRLPVIRIGRCVRVDEAVYRKFLERHSNEFGAREPGRAEK